MKKFTALFTALLILVSSTTVFALEFTQEEVMAIVSEQIEGMDFDFGALFEAADMTAEEFAQMVYVLITAFDDAQEYYEWYGEYWLYYSAEDFVYAIVDVYTWLGEDEAILALRQFAWMVDLFDILDVDYFVDFLNMWTLTHLFLILGEDIVLDALMSPVFIEVLTEKTETYGASRLMQILDQDIFDDFGYFREHSEIGVTLEYWEALLGGTFSQYIGILEEFFAATDAIENQSIWQIMWEGYSEWRYWDLIDYAEANSDFFTSNFLSIGDFETRISQRLTRNTFYEIFLEGEGGRLNLFLRNTHDQSVFFLYEIIDTWLGGMPESPTMGAFEVPANTSRTVQINFNEIQSYLGRPSRIHVAVFNPYSREIDGSFAYRWTAYPLGSTVSDGIFPRELTPIAPEPPLIQIVENPEDLLIYLIDEAEAILAEHKLWVLEDTEELAFLVNHFEEYVLNGYFGMSSLIVSEEILPTSVFMVSTEDTPLGIQDTAPILENGEQTGSIIATRSFAEDWVTNDFAWVLNFVWHNTDVSIFAGDTKATTTFFDTQSFQPLDFTVPSDISEIVLSPGGFTYITLLYIAGTYHYAAFLPLLGEDDVPVGMLKIAIPAYV
jgi:hypothetical protein